MFGGFCKVSYMIRLWVLKLCKPLVPLQIKLLTMDAYVWTNTIKNI